MVKLIAFEAKSICGFLNPDEILSLVLLSKGCFKHFNTNLKNETRWTKGCKETREYVLRSQKDVLNMPRFVHRVRLIGRLPLLTSFTKDQQVQIENLDLSQYCHETPNGFNYNAFKNLRVLITKRYDLTKLLLGGEKPKAILFPLTLQSIELDFGDGNLPLQYLTNLTELSLWSSCSAFTFDGAIVSHMSCLRKLDINFLEVENCNQFPPSLTSLYCRTAIQEIKIEPNWAQSLISLDISIASNVSVLVQFTKLKELTIHEIAPNEKICINQLPQSLLSFVCHSKQVNLSSLPKKIARVQLNIYALLKADIFPPSVESITLFDTDFEKADPLTLFPNLREIICIHSVCKSGLFRVASNNPICPPIEIQAPIRQFASFGLMNINNLEQLNIIGIIGISLLDSSMEFPSLKKLLICISSGKLMLPKCPQLTHLTIYGQTANIASSHYLAQCPQLLEISDQTSLATIFWANVVMPPTLLHFMFTHEDSSSLFPTNVNLPISLRQLSVHSSYKQLAINWRPIFQHATDDGFNATFFYL